MGKAERRGWYIGKEHMTEPYKHNIKILNGQRVTYDREGNPAPFERGDIVTCTTNKYHTISVGHTREVLDCYVNQNGVWVVHLRRRGSNVKWGQGYFASNFKLKEQKEMSTAYNKNRHTVAAIRVDKFVSLTTLNKEHMLCNTAVHFSESVSDAKQFITDRIAACSGEQWVICDVKTLAQVQPNVQFNNL